MKRLTQWMFLLFLAGCVSTPAPVSEENNLLSLDAGIDQLAFELTREVATRYFDAENRPVVRVAVCDFTDSEGDITVGARYVSTRIRLAFAKGFQFELLPTGDFEKQGLVITAKAFSENRDLGEQILDRLKADAYIFGTVAAEGNSNAVCEINIWGVKPPYDQWLKIESLEFGNPSPWNLGFTPSGVQFFDHVLLAGAEGLMTDIRRENLGRVIFLSQPICDDLSLSWEIRADGMVYDMRKEDKFGSLRNRTGQVFQSRVKSHETLKELSFIVKDATFIVKERGGMAYKFEPYILPEKSDYFFLPFSGDETGLRFQYIWGKPGLSKRVSTHETGKGWKLHMALEDYENIMPVGAHIATATLSPIAESQYGSKRPRSDYVTRFKFFVTPGLNIYVINYVYRRDRPEIFVRRLDIEGTRDVPIRSIKKITEVYRVYGSD